MFSASSVFSFSILSQLSDLTAHGHPRENKKQKQTNQQTQNTQFI